MSRQTTPILLDETTRSAIVQKRREFAQRGKSRWVDKGTAILLRADNFELREIVRVLNRPYKTVQQWLRDYRRIGAESLVPRHKPPRRRPRVRREFYGRL